jgi:hypothetical protein
MTQKGHKKGKFEPAGLGKLIEKQFKSKRNIEESPKILALYVTTQSAPIAGANYMIFYIIIGHRSNKIQILLDNDDFF